MDLLRRWKTVWILISWQLIWIYTVFKIGYRIFLKIYVVCKIKVQFYNYATLFSSVQVGSLYTEHQELFEIASIA